jgi:hypothetical protein
MARRPRRIHRCRPAYMCRATIYSLREPMAVNHSHIVPAGYLRQFALADEQIRIVLTDTGEEIPARTTVRNAGVRGSGQYKRERPDGSRSDDFETCTLQTIENEAIPILRELHKRWPLSGEDKLALAKFIGIQIVRGPRWFDWHDEFTMENISRYRANGAFEPEPHQRGISEEQIFQANLDFFRGSTQKLVTMARLGAKIGCAVGSMCWTLIEFDRSVLATSDHPIVVWPMTDRSRSVQSATPGDVGVRNFLEVRLPISPARALLMTWRDLPDDPKPVLGKSHHADNLNAFTVAEAEKQWFFLPETQRPRIREGKWLPLSAEFVQGYSASAATSTQLYQTVINDLQGRVGDESLEVEIRYLPQSARKKLA